MKKIFLTTYSDQGFWKIYPEELNNYNNTSNNNKKFQC
jgi:hypothetical protein